MIRLALGDAGSARSHLIAALEINPSFSVLEAGAARQALAQVGSA